MATEITMDSLEVLLKASNADLLKWAIDLQSQVTKMIDDGLWRGDHIKQLCLDIDQLVKQIRHLPVDGEFVDRFRAHMAAHRRHMVLAIRAEKILDLDIARKGAGS